MLKCNELQVTCEYKLAALMINADTRKQQHDVCDYK